MVSIMKGKQETHELRTKGLEGEVMNPEGQTDVVSWRGAHGLHSSHSGTPVHPHPFHTVQTHLRHSVVFRVTGAISLSHYTVGPVSAMVAVMRGLGVCLRLRGVWACMDSIQQ